MRHLHAVAAMCAAVGLAGCSMTPGGTPVSSQSLQQRFQMPPEDARIMVRWWWFGPAVTKEGIERELRTMKAGGIGGVEVQATYPLAVDGGTAPNGIRNLKLMSPEHLEMLTFTASKCKELGLRMDLTLGSGWPYGGPMFDVAEGAGALETVVVPAAAGLKTVAVANLRPGRTAFAAFVGPAGATGRGGGGGGRGRGAGRGGANDTDVSGLKEVPVESGVARLPEGFAGGEVVFFVSGRTGMQVKRPAVGAEGNVIDHLSGAVVEKFIKEIAEPAIKACVAGGNPPYAVFCDSLEVVGENWTPEFLAEFQKRRGYDLRPYLPALIGSIGERTDDVRYDYGRTLTEVYDDTFNARFTKLAHQYGSRFRIQGYGSPPAGLLSYAYSDLPEGEAGGNGNWRTFRATRYAASASHLMGQKVTSSETFTWLHQAPFRATPLDIKGEVDTHFLEGINQVICHGWPYTPEGAEYPGWSFYAAAVFDDRNPWWIAMPEITGYMRRVSAIMREGTPANDIALYLPDSDVWSRAASGYSTMNAAYTGLNGVVPAILDQGYDFDAWDDGMLAMKGRVEGGALAFAGQKYKVVVLPNVERMPLETARKLEQFAKGGGWLFAIGRVPSKVPGFKVAAADQTELQGIMQRLFKDAGAPGILISAEGELGEALKKKLLPDISIEPAVQAIGGIHRHTEGGEVYFLANTGNQKQSVRVTFRVDDRMLRPELWDPLNGQVRALPIAAKANGTVTLALDFEPLGSELVVWTKRGVISPAAPAASTPVLAPIDLSAGWSVKFNDDSKVVPMEHLDSWTTLEGRQNFSGVASYEKKVHISKEAVSAGWVLTLGDSKPAPAAGGRGGQGYAAAVVPPVFDVAVVYVNGTRAGAAWCPPFNVNVAGLLKEGENMIRIDVANTAVNALAKNGFPNYNLNAIRQVYGNRFDPQGVQLYAQPLPSGLTGPVKLEAR